MRYERDVGEPQPRTEDESPGAVQTLMSSPILQPYQGPQAGASWRKGLTALHFLDIGLSERGQMRLWELGAR